MISCKFSGVAKWNLSHCPSCWDDPSLGLTLVLSWLQVLSSHLWEWKKKKGRMEGGIKERREGRRNKKGKKERKEEGIKKEKKTKGSFLLASNKPNQFSWSSWLQQAEGEVVGFYRRCLWGTGSDTLCPGSWGLSTWPLLLGWDW